MCQISVQNITVQGITAVATHDVKHSVYFPLTISPSSSLPVPVNTAQHSKQHRKRNNTTGSPGLGCYLSRAANVVTASDSYLHYETNEER